MDGWRETLRADGVRRWIVPAGGAMVGVGLLWARTNAQPKTPPAFASHPHVARAYPGLAQAIHEIAELNHPRTGELVAHTVRAAELASSTREDAQWQLARTIAATMRLAKHICSSTPMHESDEQYRRVLSCTGDTLPQLESWFDNMLHNHLLSRTP